MEYATLLVYIAATLSGANMYLAFKRWLAGYILDPHYGTDLSGLAFNVWAKQHYKWIVLCNVIGSSLYSTAQYLCFVRYNSNNNQALSFEWIFFAACAHLMLADLVYYLRDTFPYPVVYLVLVEYLLTLTLMTGSFFAAEFAVGSLFLIAGITKLSELFLYIRKEAIHMD